MEGYENAQTEQIEQFSERYGFYKNYSDLNHITTFEEVDINRKYGLYLKPNDENEITGTIVWDNEGYILQISGDFAKDELLKLAKSAKFYKSSKN